MNCDQENDLSQKMSKIHRIVYQDEFQAKQLNKAIQQCRKWIQNGHGGEVHLYAAMAYFRLENFLLSYDFAQKGILWQQNYMKSLNAEGDLYSFHKAVLNELEIMKKRAQSHYELQVYSQKLKDEMKK